MPSSGTSSFYCNDTELTVLRWDLHDSMDMPGGFRRAQSSWTIPASYYTGLTCHSCLISVCHSMCLQTSHSETSPPAHVPLQVPLTWALQSGIPHLPASPVHFPVLWWAIHPCSCFLCFSPMNRRAATSGTCVFLRPQFPSSHLWEDS